MLINNQFNSARLRRKMKKRNKSGLGTLLTTSARKRNILKKRKKKQVARGLVSSRVAHLIC